MRGNLLVDLQAGRVDVGCEYFEGDRQLRGTFAAAKFVLGPGAEAVEGERVQEGDDNRPAANPPKLGKRAAASIGLVEVMEQPDASDAVELIDVKAGREH